MINSTDDKRLKLKMFSKKLCSPAFTIVELLIVMIIVAIVGGVAVSAFFVTLNSYRQSDDYITAAEEVEYAMAALRSQITNIGLGMPNNASGSGSFNISFTGPFGDQPIMAYMGDINRGANRNWGGPITLGEKYARDYMGDPSASHLSTAHNPSAGVYTGRELFYAWAVPTGVRLKKGSEWNPGGAPLFSSDNANPIELMLLDNGDVEKLVKFTYDFGRSIGISNSKRGANIGSWILFPSFKVPLLIEEDTPANKAIDENNNIIRVRPAPYAGTHPTAYNARMEGNLYGYEEVHLLQVACIYSNGDKLIQRIYGEDVNTYTERILANNIISAYFIFDDDRRILTMYTIARGNSRSEVSPAYNQVYLRSKLPSYIQIDDNLVSSLDMGCRILVESLTWRIRN